MATHEQQKIKALFWGMAGDFSYLALEGLINGGVDICAVISPAAITTGDMPPIMRLTPEPVRSELPLSSPYVQRTITQLAWQKQIPVYEIQHLSSPAVTDKLAALNADVAIVACFSRRIPDQVLQVPKHGFLNLHPSLLPELRGPFPLFWFFRLGHERTGVTIHFMDTGLDTGDIVMQQELSLPEGITGPQADSLLATNGTALLLEACRRLATGDLPRLPQYGAGSSFSRPKREDFHIPITWSAKRAFNFIRGTAEWQTPFHITGQGVDLYLRQAIGYDSSVVQENPIRKDGRDYWIQFTPGVLHAR